MSNPTPLALSVLDFGWVREGQSAPSALNETLALARHAETLGYRRYWLGEHHMAGYACGSPLLLSALLAASTRTIRVGVGAILFNYHSPLQLAQDARLLELFFGRFDLGLGRGRADDPACHRALLDGRPDSEGLFSEADFEAKLADLLGLLRGNLPNGHAYAEATVNPAVQLSPKVWLCGSQRSGLQAARSGQHFCCTLFHGHAPPPDVIDRYRQTFRAGPELSAPVASVAVCGACCEDEAEAQAVKRAFPFQVYQPDVLGTPSQCRERLLRIAERYHVDEIVFLDISPSHEGRARSLARLAEVMKP